MVTFGATVPLLINPAFAETTLGQNLPLYASAMLTHGARQPGRARRGRAPHRAATAGRVGPAASGSLSYVQWIGLPFVGIFFSNLPALDAQTRLLTGRYLEYRVTEKA